MYLYSFLLSIATTAHSVLIQELNVYVKGITTTLESFKYTLAYPIQTQWNYSNMRLMAIACLSIWAGKRETVSIK